MKRTLVALGFLGFVCGAAQAQEDLNKLDVWVGDWAWENHVKESPSGPEQKIEGTGEYRRLGEFFYVWRSQWKSPEGQDQSSVEMTGYDPVKQIYFTESFDSTGVRTTGLVTFSDTAVVVDRTSVSASGKKSRTRCTDVLEDAGPNSCETLTDGKWWVSSKGKSKKVK